LTNYWGRQRTEGDEVDLSMKWPTLATRMIKDKTNYCTVQIETWREAYSKLYLRNISDSDSFGGFTTKTVSTAYNLFNLHSQCINRPSPAIAQ